MCFTRNCKTVSRPVHVHELVKEQNNAMYREEEKQTKEENNICSR